MMGKMQTIRVAVLDGSADHLFFEEREALILGPLAVHKGIGWAKEKWVITHRNTGYGIGGSKITRKEALSLAAALNDLYDWDLIKEVSNHENIPAEIRDKVSALL